MKKNLLILSAIALFGCSASDDNSSVNQNENSINPPSWIRGNWYLDGTTSYGFKFTSDDVCIIALSQSACNKESLTIYQGTDVYTHVEEQTTDTKYSVDVTIGSNTTSYEFQKVSDTQIKWVNSPAQAIYIKQ